MIFIVVVLAAITKILVIFSDKHTPLHKGGKAKENEMVAERQTETEWKKRIEKCPKNGDKPISHLIFSLSLN